MAARKVKTPDGTGRDLLELFRIGTTGSGATMPRLQIVVRRLPLRDGDEQRFAMLEVDPQSPLPIRRADKGEERDGYTEVDLRLELGKTYKQSKDEIEWLIRNVTDSPPI